jgi:hypothetical protein
MLRASAGVVAALATRVALGLHNSDTTTHSARDLIILLTTGLKVSEWARE